MRFYNDLHLKPVAAHSGVEWCKVKCKLKNNSSIHSFIVLYTFTPICMYIIEGVTNIVDFSYSVFLYIYHNNLYSYVILNILPYRCRSYISCKVVKWYKSCLLCVVLVSLSFTRTLHQAAAYRLLV